jgi:hypothetical protein
MTLMTQIKPGENRTFSGETRSVIGLAVPGTVNSGIEMTLSGRMLKAEDF